MAAASGRRCGRRSLRWRPSRSRRGSAWSGWSSSGWRRRLPWRAAAAVLLAFGLGGAGGWFLHGGQQPPTAAITLLAQQAVANHVVYTADRRRPTELGAQQRDDLARWVSNRLNHQVAPPDLSADGYSYMGGRLAATPDGPAGLFMYDGPQGVRLTVFVLPLNAAASHADPARRFRPRRWLRLDRQGRRLHRGRQAAARRNCGASPSWCGGSTAALT